MSPSPSEEERAVTASSELSTDFVMDADGPYEIDEAFVAFEAAEMLEVIFIKKMRFERYGDS